MGEILFKRWPPNTRLHCRGNNFIKNIKMFVSINIFPSIKRDNNSIHSNRRPNPSIKKCFRILFLYIYNCFIVIGMLANIKSIIIIGSIFEYSIFLCGSKTVTGYCCVLWKVREPWTICLHWMFNYKNKSLILCTFHLDHILYSVIPYTCFAHKNQKFN